jgi:hypothetical protein
MPSSAAWRRLHGGSVRAVPAPLRIPPLPAEEQDEQVRELLGGVRVAGVDEAPAANIFATRACFAAGFPSEASC